MRKDFRCRRGWSERGFDGTSGTLAVRCLPRPLERSEAAPRLTVAAGLGHLVEAATGSQQLELEGLERREALAVRIFAIEHACTLERKLILTAED